MASLSDTTSEEALSGAMAGASLAAAEEEPNTGAGDGAQLAPAGTHATDALIQPPHIDAAALLGPFMRCAGKTEVAKHDYKYWGGDD